MALTDIATVQVMVFGFETVAVNNHLQILIVLQVTPLRTVGLEIVNRDPAGNTGTATFTMRAVNIRPTTPEAAVQQPPVQVGRHVVTRVNQQVHRFTIRQIRARMHSGDVQVKACFR
jgi:hypothetical protein